MKPSQKKFLNTDYVNYVKEEIKARSKNWLRPARVSGYICPCCSSGDGPHGTGIIESRKYPNSFCCFSSRTGDCWEGYQDIIGIIRHMNKDASFYDALEIAAEKVGYEFPDPELFKDPEHLPEHTKPVISSLAAASGETAISKDLADAIQEDIFRFHMNLNQTDYYLRRGLSKATVERFGCGYAPEWEHPVVANIDVESEKKRAVEILIKEGYEKSWKLICEKAADPFLYLRKHHPVYLIEHNLRLAKPNPSQRFIVPISDTAYLARSVNPAKTLFQQRYAKMKVGQQTTGFNWSVLEEPVHSPIFVTEGEFDAMSVEEVGYPALALGSVSMLNRFCSFIQENNLKPEYPLVLALDKDVAGQKATAKILQQLISYGVWNVESSILLPGTKDPNEALVKDRNAFTKKVEQAAAKSKALQAKFDRKESVSQNV